MFVAFSSCTRHVLSAVACVLIALLSTWSTHAKPNLIVIMADDMGYGDASCYGGSIPTPNLDRMAAEGMRFLDFHSSGNVCSPTRAGLMTGRYQRRAGIPGVINADPAVESHHAGLYPDKEITFAELLRDAGYATAVFGKWHLGYEKKFSPLHHGFDRFRGFVSGNIDYHSHYDRMEMYDWWDGLELIEEEGYSTHLITEHAVDFIEANKERPFCLYVAHEAVHSPFQGPNDPPVRGPAKVRRRREQGSKAKQTRDRAFREMLVELDNGVGAILEKVQHLGLSENTFVFFLSDNGPAEAGSAGPLRGRKGSDWEGGHRVPAIAWWPGKIPATEVSSQLGISLDLMPTMLGMAGVNAPQGHKLDGVDLRPVLLAGKTIADRKLFWNARAMRDGHWKLYLGKANSNESAKLFDLSQDLGEQVDLAHKYPKRVAEMIQALQSWYADVNRSSTPQRDVDAATKSKRSWGPSDGN